jgi:hypothetical protein
MAQHFRNFLVLLKKSDSAYRPRIDPRSTSSRIIIMRSRRMNLRRISSAREAVDVLGGHSAVCDLTGATLKAAYHWTNAGMFPARAYDVMKKALKRRGYHEPPRLWNQIGAVEEDAA